MTTAKKVLIVGAGPSGLACAEQILTNTEFEVNIIEKNSVVGENPRCAGGVSKYLVEKVGLSISEQCIVAKIRKVRIYAPDGNYWELKGNEDYGYVLDRTRFQQNIANIVEGLGAKLLLGHSVSAGLKFYQKYYNYIVGADGPTSAVRQWLNLPGFEPSDIHLGLQKTITMDSYPQDTVELYFGEKVAPHGYAWIFPCGSGLVRIGLGIPLSKCGDRLPVQLLNRFIERHVYEYQELNFVGKMIPTAKMPEKGVYGNIALVGDALPSTDPFTGGGICQGIASGKAVGQAITEGKLENYDYHIKWLRKQNNRRYKLKRVLYSLNDQDFNALVQVMKGFTPKTMSIGKELRHAILRLLWHKPRLIKKFFKYLR